MSSDRTKLNLIVLRIFQIVALVLILLLAASTFFPQQPELSSDYSSPNLLVRWMNLDRFYNSGLNGILWLFLTVLLVLAVIFNIVRTTTQKALHLLLALIFGVVFLNKNLEVRFFITIAEGKEVLLSSFVDRLHEKDDATVRLERFEIPTHAGTSAPKNYISHLVINQIEPVDLAVNHPVSVGKFHLYQNSYDRIFFFRVEINDKSFETAFGDTFNVDGMPVSVIAFDDHTEKFIMSIGDEEFRPPLDQPFPAGGKIVRIIPQGIRFISVIEVVQPVGVKWLAVLGLLYIFSLVLAFRQRPAEGRG